MLITDQVATAPCTDCIQARCPTFEAKHPTHSDTVNRRRFGKIARVTTTLVKSDSLNRRIGPNLVTALRFRKRLGKLEQHASMAQSLEILPDSDSPQPCHRSVDINPDDSDYDVIVNKDERMVAGFEIIRMILDVRVKLSAILEKHLPANVMERAPLFVVSGRAQLMFSDHHSRSVVGYRYPSTTVVYCGKQSEESKL